MQNNFLKKLVIGGMILAVCVGVVLYAVMKAPRKVESPGVPSSLTVASNQTSLSQDIIAQKKAEAIDRFDRLTRREEKLGITVTRGKPFTMVPPAVDSTSK